MLQSASPTTASPEAATVQSASKPAKRQVGDPSSLVSRGFVLICLAAFGFFCAHHSLYTSLALYFGQRYPDLLPSLGWLLGAFTLASLLVRPWAGWASDQLGCTRLMVAGAIGFGLMSLLYPLAGGSPGWLLALRLAQGATMGVFVAAASAGVGRLVPPERRAEGLSHYSNAIKVAMLVGPLMGAFWLEGRHYQWYFVSAAVVVLFAAMAAMGTRVGPVVQQQGVTATTPLCGWRRVIVPSSFYPGAVMSTNSFVFGALIPFATLMGAEKGIDPALITWFYPVYGGFLILSRALTGTISDRYGRSSVIIPGIACVGLTLAAVALSNNGWVFLLASGAYGLSAGVVQPSLMALAVDRAPEGRIGSAMASFSFLNDLGILSGTLLMGSLAHQVGYGNALWAVIVVVLAGLAGYTIPLLLKHRRRHGDVVAPLS